MSYTDLQTLRGLSSPVEYGSGIEYADGMLALRFDTNDVNYNEEDHDDATTMEASSSLNLQLGLWLNGTDGCHDIVAGQLDDNISRLFHYLILETPIPTMTYLRIGYEFDNPAFGYSENPALYARAFRTIVNACIAQYSASVCQSKISYVFHSWAAGVPDGTILSDYYPGDEYVDWIGVSIFSQLYDPSRYKYAVGDPSTVRHVLDFAQQHDKPIMIGESTPFGGILHLSDPWNDWFIPVLHLIDEYDITLWCYIHCNWNEQTMWHNTGFGDSRLTVNTTVLTLWQDQVLQNNPRFERMMPTNTTGTPDGGEKAAAAGTLMWSMSWTTTTRALTILVVVVGAVMVLLHRWWWPRRTTRAQQPTAAGYQPIPACRKEEEEIQ
jgi:hypothetical protein